MPEYTPRIHVEYNWSTKKRLPVLFAPSSLWGASLRTLHQVCVCGCGSRIEKRDFWEFAFFAAPDGKPQVVTFDGQLDVGDAIAAAQDHVLRHGELYVNVEVQPEDSFYILAP